MPTREMYPNRAAGAVDPHGCDRGHRHRHDPRRHTRVSEQIQGVSTFDRDKNPWVGPLAGEAGKATGLEGAPIDRFAYPGYARPLAGQNRSPGFPIAPSERNGCSSRSSPAARLAWTGPRRMSPLSWTCPAAAGVPRGATPRPGSVSTIRVLVSRCSGIRRPGSSTAWGRTEKMTAGMSPLTSRCPPHLT